MSNQVAFEGIGQQLVGIGRQIDMCVRSIPVNLEKITEQQKEIQSLKAVQAQQAETLQILKAQVLALQTQKTATAEQAATPEKSAIPVTNTQTAPKKEEVKIVKTSAGKTKADDAQEELSEEEEDTTTQHKTTPDAQKNKKISKRALKTQQNLEAYNKMTQDQQKVQDAKDAKKKTKNEQRREQREAKKKAENNTEKKAESTTQTTTQTTTTNEPSASKRKFEFTMAKTNETTTEPTLTDKNRKRVKVETQVCALPPNGDALDFSADQPVGVGINR